MHKSLRNNPAFAAPTINISVDQGVLVATRKIVGQDLQFVMLERNENDNLVVISSNVTDHELADLVIKASQINRREELI
tara:strand:+ start:215 stop:451 length:237 start_codon:yes stop_codon:yes gene_type:complete